MDYPGIFLVYSLFCSAMQYLGWVRQFVESLMIKIRNVGVEVGEVKKINFQQHPQGLLESQKTPPHRHPVGPDHLPCYYYKDPMPSVSRRTDVHV